MKKSKIILTLLLTTVISFYSMITTSTSSGITSPCSGDPASGGTNCTDCHSGGSATAVSNWITTNVPASGYVHGQTYTITATATYAALVKYGFQISPQNAAGTKLGTLVNMNTSTKLVSSSKYITHTSAGTTGTTGSHTWTFNWVAPAAGSGPVTFYGAFNCSNNNGNESGDHIYTSTTTVQEAAACTLTASIASSSALICASDSANLTASPAGLTYLWNNGATTQIIRVPIGTYTVTVTQAACTATASKTIGTTACGTPATDTVYNIFGTKATFHWQKVGCGTGYKLQYRKSGVTTWTTVTLADTNSKTISTLLPLTTYEFQVASICGGVASAYTTIKTFTTLCDCAKPGTVAVTNITGTTATFSWTGNSCAVKYKVQYRVSGTATWKTASVSPPNLTTTITGLALNTTYDYRTRTDCNSAGTFNSGWNPTLTFKTAVARLSDDVTDNTTPKIYPNPSTGIFNIEGVQTGIITVMNISGQEVYSGKVSTTLDLSALPSGNYIVKINSNNQVFTDRIQISK